MNRRLRRLRRAPVTVPMLVAVAIFVVWAQDHGGQSLTTWAPGALVIVGLLALTATSVPGRFRDAPAVVRGAVLALGAFTAWSVLSITWAGDRGAAWEGAARTVLFFAVFALFALWPQRPRTAAWVLGAWLLGLGVLAVVTVLRVPGVDVPASLFVGNRLDEPAGYPNAAAAMWLMPLWPALTLAASTRVPWALRGVFAALAAVFLDVALLSLSRGSLLAVPVVAALLFAFAPGRVRHFAVAVPVAAAAGLAVPSVLHVGDAIDQGLLASQHAASAMARTVLLLAAAAGAVVALGAVAEARRPPSVRVARRVRLGFTAAAALAALAIVAGGVAVAGNPVDRLQRGWTSFKGGYSEVPTGSRLASGLGSNRYDFYRVAVDVFRDHPITGVGADNFFQDYLQRGRSDETPAYPHNLELRTLSQTGVVGGALLLAAFGLGLAGAWKASGTRDPLAVAVAAGGAAAFGYWVAHGTGDWFWEWAGLGAPAFAFLGLACSLAPRAARAGAASAAPEGEPPPRVPAVRGRLALGACGVVALAAAAFIAMPWLAERDVEQAGDVFVRRPFEAYDRLDQAASLFGVGDRALSVKGSIALRYGDLRRADAAFGDAIARNPRDAYATLELGAIASAEGRRADALRLLGRAVALAPRDPNAREALAAVRSGAAVDVTELNRRILALGRRF